MRFLFLLSFLPFVFVLLMGLKCKHRFLTKCRRRLERAHTELDLGQAEHELDVAIRYIEEQKLTTGYTSLFNKTEENNIGVWYQTILKAKRCIRMAKTDPDSVMKTVAEAEFRRHLRNLEYPPSIDLCPQAGPWFCWYTGSLAIVVLGFWLLIR